MVARFSKDTMVHFDLKLTLTQQQPNAYSFQQAIPCLSVKLQSGDKKNKLKLVTFITTQSHPARVASLVGAEPDTVQKHQRRHFRCEWVITVSLTHFTSTKQRATPTSRVACEAAAAAAATAQKKKEDELSHPGVALSRTRHLWNLYGFHICIFLLASILSSIIPMKCRLGLNPAVKNRLESG